ncbi:MAG TPA: DUF2207 domain-containing protein [Methanobacterium sp.]|nr:DUF2207 domain-containing protein [Methanobacterium sp.]
MDKKHFIPLFLLFLFAFSVFSGVAFADDRSYSIPLINSDLYLQDDGSLHVKETIHYSFIGTYHGIFRDIPISGNQQLQNIKVSTQGAYSTFSVDNQGNNERITVNLFSDPQKTTPISDKDVNVTIEYDFTHAIKFYNDIAEIQYKLVGEGWDVDIGQLNAIIHFKSSEGVKYWLNPPYFAENSSWNGNNLQVVSKNIPVGDFFELRAIMPKTQFAANPVNGIIINQNGLSQIEAIQNDYQNEINFKTNLYTILAILLILVCFVPLLIYLKFGREPKIDYQAEYERDIPTEDPPAIVNAICGPGFSKKVGVPDMDGFKATIMDLINRKYLLFKSKSSNKEDLGVSDSIFLSINQNKDLKTLKEFELDVLNFLKGYEEDGIISMDTISESLSDRSSAKAFRETYNNWRDNIKSRFLDGEELRKIFIKKGDTYLKIFGVLGLIAAAITFFVTIVDSLPAASLALLSSLVLGVVSIISLALPEKIGGQWTTYGEEYDAKWHNFKKYIKDFSLIKEYPPESVKIWNKYLVYATALGAADAVRKAMELYLPKDQLEGSDIYMFHYYGGYAILASSFDTGISTASGSNGGDFGGVGDIGGGFGGGGGGAF